ncbi:DUF3375 domain-containing protein [Microbulbifer sp. SH-1]|uniref:DUF3375 domain-containing protein n=1 Tax=Microbulbifer sp. SH-1 TaxID=2681547 RepID=UPI00197C0BD4|nr:DUF3375 domain-containing protein [Microbulbifer sp. SH-1]
MSFTEHQARFRRLYREHAAWQLLRADNAPHILAFVSDLFREASEVPFGQARAALAAELARSREANTWETDTPAGTYLRQWIQAGWLRELDDQLTRTDACEVALRFCRGLDQRETHATASHLRIVQDAVRDLAVALSPNADERIAILEARRLQLELEIDELRAGIVRQLPEQEQSERIREVYQLASVLTSDFRRVEDEIRQLDQALRVDMIESGGGRGAVLSGLLEKEQLLLSSEAGRAFEGFFELLMDQNRGTELREQLNSILARPAAGHLPPGQRRFLERLMRELGRESERVLNVRRRTEESLRAFVESGAHLENRAVDRLLRELEQLAVNFPHSEISLRAETALTLDSGSASIRTLDSMQLRTPDQQLDTSAVETHTNRREPNAAMLQHLEAVKVMEVAIELRDLLRATGPQTIAGLTAARPINAGLEELVACLRVARAIDAPRLPEQESITVNDRRRGAITATIPRYMLHADLFSQKLEDLSL